MGDATGPGSTNPEQAIWREWKTTYNKNVDVYFNFYEIELSN